MLQVIDAGLHSTAQDAGRPGFGHLGVRRAGAADGLALRAANLLAGNQATAAALEMTLLGGTFAVQRDTLVAITGADMEARVPEEGRALQVGASHLLRAGTTLAFGTAIDGVRTYLAIAGGLVAETALGSASTDPTAGFGGIEGRPLQSGDVLTAGPAAAPVERHWPADRPSSGAHSADGPVVLTVVEGPHHDLLPAGFGTAMMTHTWSVSTECDRVGLRLDGEPLAGADAVELVSQPMLPGAVQVPPAGRPIVLMPDAPTVGGYPVPLVVTAADQHRLGQLRPGDELRFTPLTLDAARGRLARHEAALRAVAERLA